MKTLRALRALLRVEGRGLRLHRGRSALMTLLIAIPVAGMVGGGALFRMTQATPEERRANAMGSATLRVDLHRADDLARLRAALPDSSRSEVLRSGLERVSFAGRRLAARALAIAPSGLAEGGLGRGLLWPSSGRLPDAPGEVAVSSALLTGLDCELGDRVELSRGNAVTIVGTVVDREDLELPIVLGSIDDDAIAGVTSVLVEEGAGAVDALTNELRKKGFRFTKRSALGGADPFESLIVFVVGGFALFEAALIIAAAFAVGLRRRQREIGLLAATGASGGSLRTALLLSAAAIAMLGSLLGVALGVFAAFVIHPRLDSWNGRWNGAFELSTQHLVGSVLLGVFTACAAAFLPATRASRLPVRIALSGRRPPTRHSGVWLVAGLSLLFAGCALMAFGARDASSTAGVFLLGGSIIGVLGLGACSPWFLDRFAQLAAPLPLAWRLAVRDAGRFRSRNGPVVCAVLAGMSLNVLAASVVTSVESLIDAKPSVFRDDQLHLEGPAAEAVVRELESELPIRCSAELAAVHRGGELALVEYGPAAEKRRAWVACGGAELLEALGAEDQLPPFQSGHLIAFADPSGMHPHQWHRSPGEAGFEFPPVEFAAANQAVLAPVFLLNRNALAEQGANSGPPPGQSLLPWIVRLERPVTRADVERAQRVASRSRGTIVDANLLHEKPTQSFLRVVLALCLLTGLIVIFIATALSSVESAADAFALHTLGASPALLRQHLAARAGYLACLGGLLAVPGGLLPALALVSVSSAPLSFTFPWQEILITVVALPAIAFGCTWGFAWWRSARASSNFIPALPGDPS